MATEDTSMLMKRLKNLVGLATRERPPIGMTPADVILEENKMKVLRYRPRPEGLAYDTPILLVPSLINRHYVLDLTPGKSFVEYLVARGHDVYIIDWGTPGPEDRYLTFDDICDTYLGRATRAVARRSPRGKAHLLGYCLGGTLTTIYAARRQEYVASLLTLAAPVSFGAYGLLEQWVSSPDFDIDALVEATGNVPWQLMQAAFHMLRPTLNLAKLTGVIDRAWDDQFLDGFIALETWGNDNVSFPGECYRRYITELYRENRLVQGTFALGGKAVSLGDIESPTMVICFDHDNIVPLPSALPLYEQVGTADKELVRMPGGHVGAVVSRKAVYGLWPTIADFFGDRDHDPERAAVPSDSDDESAEVRVSA